MPGPPQQPVDTRFFSRIDKTDSCWLWTGTKMNCGRKKGYSVYGVLWVGGRNGNYRFAHRISYELNVGSIPDGMFVCHRCDNPLCVNPDHLFLSTPADNNHDMRDKGRAARGELNATAKLTEDIVRIIRRAYKTGATQTELAAIYNVTQANVSEVVNRRTWRHVN